MPLFLVLLSTQTKEQKPGRPGNEAIEFLFVIVTDFRERIPYPTDSWNASACMRMAAQGLH